MLSQAGAPRHRIFLLLLTVSFAAAASLPGCGGGSGDAPATVPVSGTVYLNGEPLEGASVNFVSTSGKFAAFGRTGPDGHYELAQGAVVGPNKVHITKLLGGDVKLNPEEGMDEGQLEAMAIANNPDGDSATTSAPTGPNELIPPHFSDPEKSELTYDVPAGGSSSATFRLTSK